MENKRLVRGAMTLAASVMVLGLLCLFIASIADHGENPNWWFFLVGLGVAFPVSLWLIPFFASGWFKHVLRGIVFAIFAGPAVLPESPTVPIALLLWYSPMYLFFVIGGGLPVFIVTILASIGFDLLKQPRVKTPSEIEKRIRRRRTGQMVWFAIGLVLLLALIIYLCSTAVPLPRKGKTLVAGLTLYESPEPLTGKLLFLVTTNSESMFKKSGELKESWGMEDAAVYECILSNQAIRKVTSAPQGFLVPSKGGDTFAIWWKEYVGHSYDCSAVKAWGYSEHTRQAKTILLDFDSNGSFVVVGEYAFFSDPLSFGAGRILKFNFGTGEKEFLEVPEATYYNDGHSAENDTNVFHFKCGNANYRKGRWCGFDVLTGKITPVKCSQNRSEPEPRSIDGRYVFFKGNGALPGLNSICSAGYTLLSSPTNEYETEEGRVDLKSVRVLKRFPVFGSQYSLYGLSPCKRYALICKSSGSDPVVDTYYAVNLTTGKTWVLLKDEVRRKTGGGVSGVWWLNGK